MLIKELARVFKVEHDEKSQTYYQRKHAGLTTPEEDQAFLDWHNDLWARYSVEREKCDDFEPAETP